MLYGPYCTLTLDETSQELNAAGNKGFSCIGYDECFGYEPGSDLGWHWHEAFEAILCIEGAFKLHVADEEVTLTPGTAAFINAWRPHAGFGEPKARIRSVVFDDDFVGGGAGSLITKRYVEPLKAASEIDLLVFNPDEERDEPFARHLARALDALEGEATGYEIEARAHISQMFLCAWDAAGSPSPVTPSDAVSPARTALMCDYISEHYAEPVTVGGIASAADVSEREALRCFTREFGVGPSRYLMMKRLARAAELLTSTYMPIAEVGRSVGIQSPSNFAQLFRRDYHCTPREYRSRTKG